MPIHIGVDYTPGEWRVCTLDQGHPAQFRTVATAGELLDALNQVCALYPEPTIMLSLDVAMPLSALRTFSEEQLERLAQRYHPDPAFTEVRQVLSALQALSTHSYCAPSVEYLPTIPLHRRLMRSLPGSASELCAVVTLLHHMRKQEASWPEMNFFYVHTSEQATCILVLKDGQVINGMSTLQGLSLLAQRGYLGQRETLEGVEEGARQAMIQQALNEAFWEGLTQELAGLMAIHHSEDIVMLGQESDSLAARLADLYQVYLFPHLQSESIGYEAALGAALLAEGLDQEGLASEVSAHLQILQASSLTPTFDM
ncbi:MAG TPA: DUF1464 family protein [Ktedonobacteraceae bacterium]|nr:DUF1464 family protein [Ktedonobacteraceae bacterium]